LNLLGFEPRSHLAWEISKDGKWLYIGGWGSPSVIRLSHGQTPLKKDSVAVGFRVDNDGFGVSTVAIQIDKELWLGSARGDRIAIFPLTQLPPSR